MMHRRGGIVLRKVILIPDSFKGTMTSQEICGILEKSIRVHFPEAEILSIPVADGGEGSVDSFLSAVGGERIAKTVKGPLMEDVEGFYGVIDNGRTAIIEMAACAGLPLMGDNLRVEKATTFGVGQLMLDAAERGCRRIIIGLGGSATNDFGAGAAAALGFRFYRKNGEAFLPVGENLSEIASIDKRGYHPAMRGIELIAMCDIDNPLYGENGAAYIYSPQKGADARMVRILDSQLRAVSQVVARELGVDVSAMPGAGAAGGMGGGVVAFFGAKLEMGINIVLDTVDFDRLLHGADLVVSGEGRIDAQSLRGKVVVGVGRRAKRQGVPVVAIVGDIGDDIEKIYREGIAAVFSINRVARPLQEVLPRSRSDLYLTADNIFRFIRTIQRFPKA